MIRRDKPSVSLGHSAGGTSATPEDVEVEPAAARRAPPHALVVHVVGEVLRARALGDRGRLVVGGVGDAAPEPRGLVAVGVVAEGRVNGAVDRRHRVRQRRAGKRIGVGADVGLRQQVANGIVGEQLLRRDVGGHRRRGEAVQGVVGEGLGEVLVGVAVSPCKMNSVVAIGKGILAHSKTLRTRRRAPPILVSTANITLHLMLGITSHGRQRTLGRLDLRNRY